MNKKKIIVFIIGLGFISCLFVFFLKKPKPEVLLPLIPTPIPTEIPWRTYSNQDYGYRIVYPPNWQLTSWDIKEAAKLTRVPDGSIWHQAKFKGEKGGFEVLIWENKTKAPLTSWLAWFRHEDLDLTNLPEKENYQVGGMPAIRYSQEDTARDKPLTYIFFQSEDKVFEFVEEGASYPGGETPVTDYSKMVSSFHFVEDEAVIEPKAEKVVNLAKEALSQKAGVSTEEIKVLAIEEVDWPNTALGCPQPGMFYAQVITPGYKITLESQGKTYLYHSDFKRVVFCQK